MRDEWLTESRVRAKESYFYGVWMRRSHILRMFNLTLANLVSQCLLTERFVVWRPRSQANIKLSSCSFSRSDHPIISDYVHGSRYFASKSRFDMFLNSPMLINSEEMENQLIMVSNDRVDQAYLMVHCCTFIGCVKTSPDNMYGGAICFNSTHGKLFILQSSFYRCSSYKGGAIYFKTSNITLKRLVCHDCYARYWGSSLYSEHNEGIMRVDEISSSATSTASSGSTIHLYSDLGYFSNINSTGGNFEEDGGFSCPRATGYTRVQFVQTQNSVCKALIGLAIQSTVSDILYLTFNNNTGSELAWLRESFDIAISYTVINGPLTSFRYFRYVEPTISISHFYCSSPMPLDMNKIVVGESVFFEIEADPFFRLKEIRISCGTEEFSLSQGHDRRLSSLTPFIAFLMN